VTARTGEAGDDRLISVRRPVEPRHSLYILVRVPENQQLVQATPMAKAVSNAIKKHQRPERPEDKSGKQYVDRHPVTIEPNTQWSYEASVRTQAVSQHPLTDDEPQSHHVVFEQDGSH